MLTVAQAVRSEFADVDSLYQERKSQYDKVAVGLEMEKQALEKECNVCQVRRSGQVGLEASSL